MEKTVEDDIRELELEIDSAVNRLFTEKAASAPETLMEELETPESPLEMEKGFDAEPFPETLIPPVPPSIPVPPPVDRAGPGPATTVEAAPSPPATPAPAPYLRFMDRMEAQILSLEWEISKEKLEMTKAEVLNLGETLKQKAGAVSILGRMESVLGKMISEEREISPLLMKFLLDAKETIKLVMKEEGGREIEIYKQLAYQGLEARYASLEGLKPEKQEPPPVPLEQEPLLPVSPAIDWTNAEKILERLSSLTGQMEGILKQMETRLSDLEEACQRPWELPPQPEPTKSDITVFEVSGELFGVETSKVERLFKAPKMFSDDVSNRPVARLKDLEVRMVDLTKLFSIPKYDRKGEARILVVSDRGEHKGLLIGKVLKRLLVRAEEDGKVGSHFTGRIRWSYQGRAKEIPILDLRKV